MPLIEKEKKEVFKTIPIKFEESLAERVLAYADFLESSKDHVVSEAVRYIIDRDKDFMATLASETPTRKPKRNSPPTKAAPETVAKGD
jgi:hypothetical protein